jgi:hypothetical protein
VEPPLLGIVCLHSASSLVQKELSSEYLVVWIPADNRLDVPPCRSHQLSHTICEFCHRRTGKLLSRSDELCDTALSLLGVEVFFVIARRLILGSGSVVLGDHTLVLYDV